MQADNDENITQLTEEANALGQRLKDMESFGTAEAYAHVSQSIRAAERRSWRVRLTRYAACLALPLLLSTAALAYLLFTKPEEPVRYAEITALNGTTLRYELPDSSTVWLNSGSRLRYPTEFRGEERQVELSGEGYFEVSADKRHPFYVNTASGVSVYVYGTKFNVSAYEEDETVETTLDCGIVNVLIPGGGEPQVMRPGETLCYDRRTRQVTRSDTETLGKTAWRNGELVFRNTSLEEVMARLERHFNVNIELLNPKKRQYRYHATFRNENVYQILDYLSRSADMTWTQKGGGPQATSTIYVTLK